MSNRKVFSGLLPGWQQHTSGFAESLAGRARTRAGLLFVVGCEGSPTSAKLDITEFSLPTPNSRPFAITAGPDGNLWFTLANQIGRITPAGQITLFPLPTQDSLAFGITSGPGRALWFTEDRFNKIGRFTLAGK